MEFCKVTSKVILIAASILSGANVKAGLIDETWQVQVTSVSGDYIEHAVNDIFDFTFEYDNSSHKATDYSYGLTAVACASSVAFDADCSYSFAADSLANITENDSNSIKNEFFAFDDIIADGGNWQSIADNFAKTDWRYQQGTSTTLALVGVSLVSASYNAALAKNEGLASVSYLDNVGGWQYSSYSFDVLNVTSLGADQSIAVNEPTTFFLLAIGLLGLVARRKKIKVE